MDVKSLYALVAIADHGSFAEAARAMGVSISKVSLQMRALEEALGEPVFDRTTRPPRLTEEGERLVAKARVVIRAWEDLSDRLKTDETRGVLRIGAAHTLVSGALPEALRRLQKRAPELSVRLETALSHHLDDMVRRGALDAAIVTDPGDEKGDLDFAPIADEPLVVIAGPEAEGEDWRALLERNPYVRFNRLARVGRLVDQRLAENGVSVVSQMEVDTMDGVIALVARGLGVSIIPDRRPAGPLPPGIRVAPIDDPQAVRRLGVLQRPENPRRRFADMLAEELRAVVGR